MNTKMMERSRTFVKMALVGALLIGSGAAVAADEPADWTTKLKVKLVLLEKLGVDSLRVEVDSDAGAVTLQGTVNKRETRELAETITKSVEGVKAVRNEVRLAASVENPSRMSVAAGEAEAEVKDAVLSTRIRLALVEKLGADGLAIGMEVADGVAALTFPHDFAAARRREAVEIARGVDGVSKVVSVEGQP
jgi:osmotically-inducible protein OsmY